MTVSNRLRHLLRISPVVCLAVFVGSARAQGSHAFDGVWLIEKEVRALRTSDGSAPPLLPAAVAQYAANQAAIAGGDKTVDRAQWCASAGVPRLLLDRRPFEIMVDAHQVGFFFEWNRWVRLVDMSGAQLKVQYPMSFGTVSGRWESGNKLVIDSKSLMKETLMDSAGLPHSDELNMRETLTLVSADVLENRIRFEDAATFSAPWETVVRYRRQAGAQITEDVCLDRIKQGMPAIGN